MNPTLFQLAEHILENEIMNEFASKALKTIGSCVQFHNISENNKVLTFELLSSTNSPIFLLLSALKGSFLTVLWNTFARFDDEYSLEVQLLSDKNETSDAHSDPNNNSYSTHLLWKVRGVDAMNAKITQGQVDWFQLRNLQQIMQANSVGVSTFTKLLGRMLLSFPNYYINKQYIATMPASFMFNYLMVVTASPLEVTVPDVHKFLNDTATLHEVDNMGLLRACMLPDGRGAWVQNFFPFWLSDGSKALCSRFYHTVYTQQKQKNGAERSNSATTVSSSGSSSTSSRINTLLFQDTAVRVVELREHPLGASGVIAVIELVHHRKWSDICRYVVLDAHKLCRMVRYGGLTPALEDTRVPMVDLEEWRHRVRILNHGLKGVDRQRRNEPAPDLANGAQWGCPLRDKDYYAAVQQAVQNDQVCSSSEAVPDSVAGSNVSPSAKMFRPISFKSNGPTLARQPLARPVPSNVSLPPISTVLSLSLTGGTALGDGVRLSGSGQSSVGYDCWATDCLIGPDHLVVEKEAEEQKEEEEEEETVQRKRKRASAAVLRSRQRLKPNEGEEVVVVDEPLPSIFLSIFPPPSAINGSINDLPLVTMTTTAPSSRQGPRGVASTTNNALKRQTSSSGKSELAPGITTLADLFQIESDSSSAQSFCPPNKTLPPRKRYQSYRSKPLLSDSSDTADDCGGGLMAYNKSHGEVTQKIVGIALPSDDGIYPMSEASPPRPVVPTLSSSCDRRRTRSFDVSVSKGITVTDTQLTVSPLQLATFAGKE